MNRKYFLTATLVAGSIFLSVPVLAQFKDLRPTHPAYPAVNKLVQEKMIEVGKDKKFNGQGYVTKYQIAVLLDRLYARTTAPGPAEAKTALDYFDDVPVNSYAFNAVGRLTGLKLFEESSARKFYGNTRISRYYFFDLISRFIEVSTGRALAPAPQPTAYRDVQPTSLYYINIQKLVGAGLLPGGGNRNLQGSALLTRLDMATFTAKTLAFLTEGKSTAPTAAPKELARDYGYPDVPADHYAREAINELVDVEILPARTNQKFYGDRLIDKYALMDLLAKMLEKLLIGQGGNLDLADASLGYKDVETTNPAFPSIQKLIALGLLQPGNREELFNGDLLITRNQLVYFQITYLGKILSGKLEFQPADPAQSYRDVQENNFAYPAVQKAIWLGALPGGTDKEFKGDRYADRFDLAYITVQVLKAVYFKIKEEEIALTPSVDYGFKTMLTTSFNYNHITGGSPAGGNLVDLNGQQTISLTVNRQLGQNLFGYAQLQDGFSFGTQALQYLTVNEANLSGSLQPFSFQVGRIYTFYGYSPFGNSLFFDRTADLAQMTYQTFLGNFSGSLGKLVYTGDLFTDSNFGSFLYNSVWGPLEMSLGYNLVTDIIAPDLTTQLPSRAAQNYAGFKLNLTGALEINAEFSNVDFSDPQVLPFIGVTDEVQTSAYQFALSYFQPDYAYSLSLGFQHVGDDFYNGGLALPTRGQVLISIKSRFDISPEEYISVNISSVYQSLAPSQYVMNGTYSRKLFRLAYLNCGAIRTLDQTSASLNSVLNLFGNLSVSF